MAKQNVFQIHTYAAAKRPAKPRRAPQPVTRDQVVTSLWQHAMTLAGGDVRRIEIVSRSKVIVG